MSDASIVFLRTGMKNIICDTFKKIDNRVFPISMIEILENVNQLEEIAYNRSAKESKVSNKQSYTTTMRFINSALLVQHGPFPDDILGIMFIKKIISADELILISLKTVDIIDSREIIRRMFISTLINSDTQFNISRKLTLEIARKIELSCYNASVRISKESEDPPRRQWNSPPFVDIYSTRCGIINGMLDNNSMVCRAYGINIINKIIDKTIRPEDLGNMTSMDLCPSATIAEKDEIAKRVVQKVKLKESTLFQCPSCKERRCSYQEVQLRSLDEAPDYRCLCLNCNKQFTGHS